MTHTFIMKWNPEISDVSQEKMQKFIRRKGDIEMRWSLYDWRSLDDEDRFFMLRCDDSEQAGIFMDGDLDGEAIEGLDWKGTGNKAYYARLYVKTAIDSERMPILSTEVLEREMPDFDWRGGHSGVVLPPKYAGKLEMLWAEYLLEHQREFSKKNSNFSYNIPERYGQDSYCFPEALKEYIHEHYEGSCELCGYDYQKLFGEDCPERVDYAYYYRGENYSKFKDVFHCVCENCRRLIQDSKDFYDLLEEREQNKYSVL